MFDGYVSVASGTPKLRLADCRANAEYTFAMMRTAEKAGVQALVLPELGLTGATCGDLFLDETLIKGAEDALATVLEATRPLEVLTAVGVPLRVDGALYDCAAVIQHGIILGIVPKSTLTDAGAFRESRWFSPAPRHTRLIHAAGQDNIPFGAGLVFQCVELPELAVGFEIGSDLWTPFAPDLKMCADGAVIIGCLSASAETVAAGTSRRKTINAHSARLLSGFLLSGAGEGESVADAVYGAHQIIAENGSILAERCYKGGLLASEIDVRRLDTERRRLRLYDNAPRSRAGHMPPPHTPPYPDSAPHMPPHSHGKNIPFSLTMRTVHLTRRIPKTPFVPEDKTERDARCQKILHLGACALKRRLESTGAKSVVLGLSGGLDSTLALLTAVRAMAMADRPANDVIAVTMPGFGTTDSTLTNAVRLAGCLGAALRTVPISTAVLGHFHDIQHDPAVHDVTYENAQARERTQILMDIANETGGIMLGTGDLSELALGWCTYNGDHMSMYGVNASVPKTLVRAVVEYSAEHAAQNETNSAMQDENITVSDETSATGEISPDESGAAYENSGPNASGGTYENSGAYKNSAAYKNSGTDESGRAENCGCSSLSGLLRAVLDTPISPELLPAVQNEPSQRTEELVGPYELHDFFLYYFMRWHFSPRKIYRLALSAFEHDYSSETILRWLQVFFRRFFSQQFKRSCMPEGPAFGSVSLSPRSGWQMPSDAVRALWLDELDKLES